MKKVISLLVLFALLLSLGGCNTQIHRIFVVSGEEHLYEPPPMFAKAGDTVTIKTHMITCAGLVCTVNGESIDSVESIEKDGKYTHWEYCFVMPDEIVELELFIVGGA